MSGHGKPETIRRILILIVPAVFCLSYQVYGAVKVDPKLYGSPEGQICIKCHELKTPGLFRMRKLGRMAKPKFFER